MTDMHPNYCRKELERLTLLAEKLKGSMAEAETALDAWHQDASKLLDSPALESLQGELALDRLSLQLRTTWLRYANHVSSRYLKSPLYTQMVYMPSGAANSFPYDRWVEPRILENRAVSYHPAPPGWKSDHVMFNSGMASMTCLLQVMRSMFQPRHNAPLHLHGVGGYFEIMDLINISNDELFQFRIFETQQLLQESVARSASQLLYIEPVSTTYNLDVFSLEGFLQAWKQRSGDLPTILVFDTTVTGNQFPIEDVLTRIGPSRPGIVIQISSLLKLDQEGLEFSNGGLMSIYSTQQPNVDDIAKRMRKYRAALGLGLTMEQIAALDYPGFLDRESTDRYADRIFRHNAQVASELKIGEHRLFAACSHPVLGQTPPVPWAVAPFVYVRLKQGSTPEDRKLLREVISRQAIKRGLPFQAGSSFGFRSHRIEMGGIRDTTGTETLRIAMGSREGPGIDATIDFINELSELGSFERIRERFPEEAKAYDIATQRSQPQGGLKGSLQATPVLQ